MSASDTGPLPAEGSDKPQPLPPAQPAKGEPQPIPQPVKSEPTPIPQPAKGEPQPIPQPVKKLAPAEAPLPLVDDTPLPVAEGGPSAGPSKIKTFGSGTKAAMATKELSRPMNLTGTGATRCRLFHSKITVSAVDHMVGQINEWLDGSDIEVKHVTEVVGVMEGKKAEPNLILTVWY